MNKQPAGREVKTSTLTLQIIESVVDLQGARVTEVAEDLEISESAACNHLLTLQYKGFLVQRGDEYYPSLKFLKIGEDSKNRDPAFQHAIEVTNKLDSNSNFRTSFTVEENGIGRYLRPVVNKPNNVDRFFSVGENMYLHTVAAGKAILANYPEKKVNRIIERWGLPKETDQTITTREELMNELEDIRERGYANNHGENFEGVRAVGQAVHRPNGTVLGAFSVGGAAYRINTEEFEEYSAELLEEYVSKLEDQLK